MIIIVLIVITATFFTLLPPSVRFSGTEAAYDTIFATSIRMSIASLAAFTFADFLDVHIFSRLRNRVHYEVTE